MSHRSIRILTLLSCLAPCAAQTTWYVDAANPGPGSGTQANPFATIQSALDAVAAGDHVVVQPGTYPESLTFPTFDVTVASTGGADVTTIDGTGCTGPAVVVLGPTPGGTILRGFRIANGCGGGVSCFVQPGSLRIEECVIADNQRFGVSVTGSLLGVVPSITIRDCAIESNRDDDPTGESRGGGLEAGGFVQLRVERTRFTHNQAGGATTTDGSGGAVFLFALRPENPLPAGLPQAGAWFVDCDFDGNTATGDGTAAGGAMEIISSHCSILRCRFRGNRARSQRWIARSHGGAIHAANQSEVTIDASTFDDNAAEAVGLPVPPPIPFGLALARGGAIASADATTVTMTDCILRKSAASASGPAQVDSGGAAVAVDVRLGGGAVTRTEMDRCTVVGSSGPEALLIETTAEFSATNSIFWEPTGTAARSTSSGSVDVSYCNLSGGWPGTGNIDLDPAFHDPANGDLRLTAGSPCIDAGVPAARPSGVDVDGHPRFLDGDLDLTPRVDMGAHEFGNAHLSILGDPTPGGSLTFEATGTRGLSFVRLVATGTGELALLPYGALLVDPLSAQVFATGTIPDRTTVAVPVGAAPTTLVFQDVAVASSMAGNTSNAVQIVVR